MGKWWGFQGLQLWVFLNWLKWSLTQWLVKPLAARGVEL